MDLSNLNLKWQEALKLIEKKLNDKNLFETFFKESTLIAVQDGKAYVEVSTRFAKELLNSRYLDLINSILEQVTKMSLETIIKVENEERSFILEKIEQKTSVFNTNLNKSYTFENFVVGPSNKEAHSASLTAALEPGSFYNPLFIYGKSGIGKTHLLHAIGNYILSKNNKNEFKVYYTPSTDFLEDYMYAVRTDTIELFKEKFKLIDIFLVDDIQFLSRKEKTAEIFFHIFNFLINENKQIVITSDRSPNHLSGLEERLVSRFTSGLSIEIRNPEIETALLILKKKIELLNNFNKRIDEDVLQFIASRYSKDVRQLEGALNRLLFYVDSFKKQIKKIDLDLAKEALKGLVATNNLDKNEDVTPEKIKMIVADYYKISVSQMISSTRLSNVTNARHIAMYFIRDILDLPFSKIGYEFGNRDHSTVISAVNKVEKMFKKDPNYKQVINDIKDMLK